ncbi:MAG: alanine--tRNA ligase-related protein, partial [Anaerolineae bacterium]
MDSNRLYYQDAYATEFTAQIVDQITADGRAALILDPTFFYPTSGGQPFDTGKINDVPVIDVTIRESDGAVLHWLARPLAASSDVTAVLDWPRRFDHMQQHTGQHILTG